MRNTIAFQHRILVVPNVGIDNRNMAMSVQAKLMQFGFMLDADALNQLGYADAADIVEFHDEVLNYVKVMLGADKDYVPFYKGFPKQVMATEERKLWMDRILNYWTNGAFVGDAWIDERKSAFETVNYKIIKAGTEQDFVNIFKTLASAGTSLLPADLKTLVWFINNYPRVEFPEVIPFKENLCTILGELVKSNRPLSSVVLPKLTTTDVLRIIVALSGGDISLPAVPIATIKTSRWSSGRVPNPKREEFKFKKFSRKERRTILGLLENSNLDVREMKLKDQRWIRIGEILHPSEYTYQFPRTSKAFQRLRNEKVRSWYGEVQAAFNQSFDVGLAKLSERPGEFIRRLDWMLRTNGQARRQSILDALSRVGRAVSNKVLFEVFDHFEQRYKPVINRSIKVKGARKATRLPDLPALSQDLIIAVQSTVLDALKGKFADLPELGECWVDEELKKIPLPTNMRSLSESLVPTIRGQRVPLGKIDKTLRMYLLCPNKTRTHICIDLSSITVGDRLHAVVDFTRLKLSDNSILHSGDSYGRTGNVSEFIDFDMKKLREAGYKYTLIQLNNFHNSPELVENNIFGFCELDHPDNNRIWEPETVITSMKIRVPNKVNLLLVDLITNEYILIDEDDTDGRFVNMISKGDIMKVIESYAELPTLSVYDLLKWHVEARGRMVSKETAAVHFLYEDFASSYAKTIQFMGV